MASFSKMQFKTPKKIVKCYQIKNRSQHLTQHNKHSQSYNLSQMILRIKMEFKKSIQNTKESCVLDDMQNENVANQNLHDVSIDDQNSSSSKSQNSLKQSSSQDQNQVQIICLDSEYKLISPIQKIDEEKLVNAKDDGIQKLDQKSEKDYFIAETKQKKKQSQPQDPNFLKKFLNICYAKSTFIKNELKVLKGLSLDQQFINQQKHQCQYCGKLFDKPCSLGGHISKLHSEEKRSKRQ